MKSGIAGKIIIFIGPVLFAAAAVVLYRELRFYSLEDILRTLAQINSWQIYLALALTVISYLIMSSYDVLALEYIRHPQPYRRTGVVSFIGYAFSNNMGLAMISGGSVRYRLYSLWGFTVPEITKIVTFCIVTLWLGFLTLSGITFLSEPRILTAHWKMPLFFIYFVGLMFIALVAAVVSLTRVRKKLKIGKWEFSLPSTRIMIRQIIIASLDWALAGSVLYVLLPYIEGFSFFNFLCVYLVAEIAALISQIPGGLGVFESGILLLIPPEVPHHELIGALLIYRSIYYILPLLTATFLLGLLINIVQPPRGSVKHSSR